MQRFARRQAKLVMGWGGSKGAQRHYGDQLIHVKHCIYFFFFFFASVGGVVKEEEKRGGKKKCTAQKILWSVLRLNRPHLEHATGGEGPHSQPP